MKNSSLHILKPILAFLLGWILVLSCSQEETNPDLPAGVPGPNASEAVVKLLIKGEAILPPSTRNMSDQTEGSYQDELQLLILEKQTDDNTYIYNCHRPVEGTQGNFTVKVPNSLDGKELKFLLFSNSKDIIGDPDQKFMVTDGTNKNEDYIRTALLLTVNTKWESSKKIPMWAEDSFTFSAPTPGAPSSSVATLKLMRMLARVDVGLNYNGKELNSTSQALSNFKLQKIKVYHSKDKGQLMPNTSAYETTGAGADKVITIKTPSVPADGETITAYEIAVPAGSHASERDVYLFEQDMNLSQAGFDVNRTCILVQGEYTAPAPAAGGTGTTYTGWYRLDFRDFGSDKGYADILRNKLYRFNITNVKGSGFSTEDDALNSVSSNITVELLALDLNQNDIIFDGQSFLSVSGSELYFYQDRNTANFSLNTNYGKGWKIEIGNGITATPAEGAMGSSVVDLIWNPLPTGGEQKEIYLTAGNLKKKLILTYVHEMAPGDLTNFTLDPPFLYFAKTGGTGKINIVSNITKKYLSVTEGKLSFAVPSETESESFNVVVNPFTATSTQRVEQGVVSVHVRAANADVKGQSIINQLTYNKDLDCAHPGRMEHGVGSAASFAYLDVPYTTTEAAGTYLINFIPSDGGIESGPDPSRPENGQGTVQIAARPNKTSTERTVGKLLFMPAEDGKEISLIGYTPKELTIKQEPVPPPVVSITPGGNLTDLLWNQTQHSFTVEVDNLHFVDNNRVAITTLSKARTIDMTVPAWGTLGNPVNFSVQPNRSDSPKRRLLSVEVSGHGDHTGTGQVEFTQQVPPAPAKEPVADPVAELAWDATSTTLNLRELSNIFEVTAEKQDVGNSHALDAVFPQNFTMSQDKSSATLGVTFSKNPLEGDRKIKVIAKAIGNRESVVRPKEFTLTQKGLKKGVIEFVNYSHPLLESGQVSGDVFYDFANIDPNSVKMVGGNDYWINYVVQKPPYKFLSFATSANSGSVPRSVTFKLTAMDLIGRPVETSTTMTLTQAPPSVLEILTKDLSFGHVDNASGRLQLKHSNIQESTFRVSKPNWIKSANISGQQIDIVAFGNSGDSPERTGTLTVEGQDAFGQQMSSSVQVKQKPNIISVNNSTLTLDGIYAHSKVHRKSISVNSGSRSFKTVRIKTYVEPTDALYPEFLPALSTPTKAEFQITALPNNNTYDERRREIELGWISPEDTETISRHTIVRPGHPLPFIDRHGGNLPHNDAVQTNVNGDSEYNFTVTAANLKPGSAFWVNDVSIAGNAVSYRIELFNDRGQKVNNFLANTRVSGKLKLILTHVPPGDALMMDLEFWGLGVDGKRRIIHTIRYRR